MKSYIGTKIIKGEPMNHYDFCKHIDTLVYEEMKEEQGYKVVYPDGYVSWSPKDVFEASYREVSDAEKSLILKE